MSLLLDSYSLKNVSELELFDAARQWLLYDSERYYFLGTILHYIFDKKLYLTLSLMGFEEFELSLKVRPFCLMGG